MRPSRRRESDMRRLHLHGMPLPLAITLALIVELIVLFMLHKAFFSAPLARHMRVPAAQVEQHMLNTHRSVIPRAVIPQSIPATKAQP